MTVLLNMFESVLILMHRIVAMIKANYFLSLKRFLFTSFCLFLFYSSISYCFICSVTPLGWRGCWSEVRKEYYSVSTVNVLIKFQRKNCLS